VCVCVNVGGSAAVDKLKQKMTCKLNSGAVVMSGSGQLPCKSVIHVQYPPTIELTITNANHLSSDESEALKCCIVNILAICMDAKYQFNTIAIPVIGSYSNKEKLADCMLSMAMALHKHVEVIKSLSVRYIVLVASGADNFKLFHNKLHLVFASDPNNTFNAVHINKCIRINDYCVSLVTGDLLMMKVCCRSLVAIYCLFCP
jgi:hypothetical protein